MNEWEWQLLEDKAPIDSILIEAGVLKIGDRVRLRLRQGGDVMDSLLTGKIGIIESIEQDYESKIQLAIVMEDDPGRDLGMLRQPGHRFFFGVGEVEKV